MSLMELKLQLRAWQGSGGDEELAVISGQLPAVLEVGGRVEADSLRLSDRKSSMEGLSRGRLSCCSPTSWRTHRGSERRGVKSLRSASPCRLTVS